MFNDRHKAQRAANELSEPVEEARNLAQRLGLNPYPVNYWIVDYDEMNQLIAYGGFQTRYPHWRWGMKYDRQKKKDQYFGGKAFEIVNHDNPANAFLQESNAVADQKAVITHVEAHSDFFAKNAWFQLFHAEDVDSAAMLERHAEQIEEIMERSDVDREEVEKWIDHLQCIENNIDQHREFTWDSVRLNSEEETEETLKSHLEEELGLSDEVQEEIFDEEWLAEQEESEETLTFPPEPVEDLMEFFYLYGKQYDETAGKATEYEDWQRQIIEIIRTETYYFAPQRMTKIMNEGWAAYWESVMMSEEGFAGTDEFITYADHQAKVLGSGGFNPYSLGIELWQYIENKTNRREVIEQLLRVDGITWRNLHDKVDFDHVLDVLEPPEPLDVIHSDRLDEIESLGADRVDMGALDRARNGEIDLDKYPWKVLTYEGLAERHYSLVKPQNRSFLQNIELQELEQISRYLFDVDRYDTVDEALADVDYTAGWDRMYEVRESHNDVTFLAEFLSQEFADENNYYTYEYSYRSDDFRSTGSNYENVKKKLLLEFTNFGKPRVTIRDANYQNQNELLLAHEYNGIQLDLGKAIETLKRIFELWGRPVHLMTIRKEITEKDEEVAKRRGSEPEPEEVGKRVTYDGDQIEVDDLNDELTEEIKADDVDYDTKPDEWL